MEKPNGSGAARVAEIARSLKGKLGALMPILHRVQEEFGCIPPELVPVIAGELNLSRAEVHGVVSFYHDFRKAPAGRFVLHLCQAESCQALGAVKLAAEARKLLGIDFGQTTADGKITLLPVYCLGNCACSPALMVNRDVHGRVDSSALRTLIAMMEEA